MLDYYPLLRRFLFRLQPETALSITIGALRLASTLGTITLGTIPFRSKRDDPILACRVWGCNFDNPIGLAAGLDKDAKVVDGALSLGFGFVEVGAVTPQPQLGNTERPRLFRLVEDEAIINRFGFPNEGLEKVCARLQRRRTARGKHRGIIGANIGVNDPPEDTALALENALLDFVRGVKALANLVNYLVINVSCPNTPSLRALQQPSELAKVIDRVMAARAEVSRDAEPPLLIKIDPDLDEENKVGIAKVALDRMIDGLIVSNTTKKRPETLKSRDRGVRGGLSGRPLFARSTEVLGEMYRLTEGRIPLIGLGGVASGRDAYTKIRSGASLVQLYTALVYQGPSLVQRIKKELAQLLREDGFSRIEDAVGADVPLKARQDPKEVRAAAPLRVPVKQDDPVAGELVSSSFSSVQSRTRGIVTSGSATDS